MPAVTAMGIGRGSSASKQVQFLHSQKTSKGHFDVVKTLNCRGIRDFQAKGHANLRMKVAGVFCS
jgi:hypothetical protein